MYNKILILGSGGLRIGQAGEFDYSGSQAIKALKEEGIQTILVNPNIATVQTDLADVLYSEPLAFDSIQKIIEKERPDGILLGFGGQTALNLGLELERTGILQKYQVEVMGTSVAAIRKTEDRDLFKQELASIGIVCPKSMCVDTVQDALHAAEEIGYPIMLRAGFSLGGQGSGKVNNADELKQRASECLATLTQILIEEYLFGWKEFEYEIIRDCDDNALTICSMENLDPMGIHTGESIVIAPAQTLSNTEHQLLRDKAIAAARHFGIVGECNIQFAVNPKNGDYRVIEMNARLSRSSALASKATGYPLAFVAAKLALGKRLHEIKNVVTQKTCAFFEPALDYVVIKIPRWDTHKLKGADNVIGTEMKSVGEVMGIGRSFAEALQKAVHMLNKGGFGLSDYASSITDARHGIEFPTDRRLFALYRFFLQDGSLEEAASLSQISLWFLSHIQRIAQFEVQLENTPLTAELLLEAKRLGFSDRAIAECYQLSEAAIRSQRQAWNIRPFVKQIDTLAGEFQAETNYLYVTYHASSHDVEPSPQPPVLILGSGPYSIGSSVEFDWCAVNTARALRQHERLSILINSNPETVSTDFDESDRLYFEELTFERVQDIAEFEAPFGIVVSVGGQVANNLALPLSKAGFRLLGTDGVSIDRAENRETFSALLNELEIDQPEWQKVASIEGAKIFAENIGYPVLIRPSYILSGSAMNVVTNNADLEKYLNEASLVSKDHPVVISKFIEDAKELEVDGVAEHGKIVIQAITEHIENAGIHSGDATLVMPPQRLYLETIRKTKKITAQIVAALHVTGPFNIQFIAKNNFIRVIECNVRASRSFPFVSKVTGYNFIHIAIRAMLGIPQTRHYETLEMDYVGVKVPQFSYQRLKGANPVANVEMSSTGEVACLGENLHEAYLRAWLATDQKMPIKRLLVSLADRYKQRLLPFLKHLDELGWEIYGTSGTHAFLTQNGVGSYFVYKASEGDAPNITQLISARKVELIINLPREHVGTTLTDGYHIRRMAVDHHIPLITNVHIASVMLQCLVEYSGVSSQAVISWGEYLKRNVRHGDFQE